MKVPRDGGPAFPAITQSVIGASGGGGGEVAILRDPQPAEGMSLRDYFAGQALVGFVASGVSHRQFEDHDAVAAYAYQHADAMLAERERQS